jgi:hypothetical protein
MAGIRAGKLIAMKGFPSMPENDNESLKNWMDVVCRTRIEDVNAWNALTGRFLPINGTTTNDDAIAGRIGEYISTSIVSASAVSLSSGSAKTIASISLTPGDWDVWINGVFTGGNTTTVNYTSCSISSASASFNSTVGRFGYASGNGAAVFGSFTSTLTTDAGPIRIPLASAASIYYVAVAGFSTSTCSAYGILQARRRR